MSSTALKRKERKIQTGEFWTSRQRQSHPIHYGVSYRASFKPELPSFFLGKYLSESKGIVLDPFGGRGTTSIQANLEGHAAIHNDISPMSLFLAKSRQNIPSLESMQRVLDRMDLKKKSREEKEDKDLLAFYHKDTLNEIKNLRRILSQDSSPEVQYIGVTALSRLHGHSDGFFSVYSFPQISIPAAAQKRNNEKRGIQPVYKEVKPRILQKMKRDLKTALPPFYHEFSGRNRYTNHSSLHLESIEDSVVDLVITSPPFLDKVNYEEDNWLRYWFLEIDLPEDKKPSIFSTLSGWSDFIRGTLEELSRVLKPGGVCVVEVGDVTQGKTIVNLDESVIDASADSGLQWETTFINDQKFTKLSNCWNVSNNEKGTNSNRCVVFRNFK
ncbi:site-specific DNA-methyltransferase [Leptospira gomenensis]|uniref:Methyltransferase n=1 Tax=Leptospira gomenensis TaxID=2484974 RepID=A0A5F1YGP8_9LEPT|nr:DNA methyltransferase [Leptospira gomenensis]TGK39381.1 site-specific DNA-methyltransferase [Leptospira gomenensis]TGK44059.1 site-specific DNA-methyltransferase [Leptospira gomenensis]TGK44322.1 site-specific DNA-methyltransferase [Leptospira gomenensis]TGK65833.1 site-specific DNA-methyltransferase [Leptospira gomenensis]